MLSWLLRHIFSGFVSSFMTCYVNSLLTRHLMETGVYLLEYYVLYSCKNGHL